jgi:hypothetical protein
VIGCCAKSFFNRYESTYFWQRVWLFCKFIEPKEIRQTGAGMAVPLQPFPVADNMNIAPLNTQLRATYPTESRD